MRRWLLFASALLIATAGVGGGLAGTALAASPPAGSTTTLVPAKAAPRQVAGHESVMAGTKQLLRLTPKSAQPHALAQAQPQAPAGTVQNFAGLAQLAKINVTYIGFSAPARAAFQQAVNIWQTQIHSTVPIDVVADWSNLSQQYGDPNILGAAGPDELRGELHQRAAPGRLVPGRAGQRDRRIRSAARRYLRIRSDRAEPERRGDLGVLQQHARRPLVLRDRRQDAGRRRRPGERRPA